MADDINTLLAQLDSVEGFDPDLKTKLTDTVKVIVRERGEFGSKLTLKDKEISTLKTQSMGYAKAHEALQKSGVNVEDIPKLLEGLGVQKTLEEENTFLKGLVQNQTKEAADAKKEAARLKAEKSVSKLLEKHLAEFTDEQGKKVTIVDSFIDVDKLLDGVVSVTDETVLTEKIKQALKDGYTRQEELKAKLGFPGAKVPGTTPSGTTPTTATSLKDIATIMKEQGPAAAIAAARSLSKQG